MKQVIFQEGIKLSEPVSPPVTKRVVTGSKC